MSSFLSSSFVKLVNLVGVIVGGRRTKDKDKDQAEEGRVVITAKKNLGSSN